MTLDLAEKIALDALTWLSGYPDEIEGFLSLTGVGIGDLRALAETAEFKVAVLDYVLADDTRTVTFAHAAGHAETAVGEARLVLAGGPEPHWT